jgi:hypothetical protein
MRKTKTPAATVTLSDGARATLTLFYKNLEEVKRWYRGSSDAGRELGHIVLAEMFISHVSRALELAMEGKTWSPPEEHP